MTASLPSKAALFGQEGELISLSVRTEAKLLEQLLETLASLDFPINPQLYHRPAHVLVEFPAYTSQVVKVQEALACNGFDAGCVGLCSALAQAKGV